MAALLLPVVLISACSPLPSAQLPAVQAWVDSPLNGSEVALAPLELVAHGASPIGILQLEFSADGEVFANQPAEENGVPLVTAHQPWQPPAPGAHQISVRAQAQGGGWSDPASVVVFVRGRSTEVEATANLPLTATASAVPSSTPTLMVTSTAEPSATPTIEPAGSISIQRVSSRQLYYYADSCGQKATNILASATHPQGIEVVVLFYRVVSTDGSLSSAWAQHAMSPAGPDIYSLSVNPEAAFGLSPVIGDDIVGPNYRLEYQAVLQTQSGDTSVRTSVISDVQVDLCKGV